MPGKDHGPSIKDPDQYERLREKGMGKEKAARIANTPRSKAAKAGGKAPPYEEWSRDELREKARELDIARRSRMKKSELIKALRNR